MNKNVCSRIIWQNSYADPPNIGINIRIQCTKILEFHNNANIEVIFDINVNDINSASSELFTYISVSNNGDFILLRSSVCCILAKIPWEKSISKGKTKNKILNNRLISGNIRDNLIYNKPSHLYGLFEVDSDDFNFYSGFSRYEDDQNILNVEYIFVMNIDNIFLEYYNNNSNFKIISSEWYAIDDNAIIILTSESININYSPQNIDNYIGRLHIFDISNIVDNISEEDNKDIISKGIIETRVITIPNSNNEFVDFCFGSGPDLWNMMSIFILCSNGTVWYICPIISNNLVLPSFTYQTLYSTLLEQDFLAEAPNDTKLSNGYNLKLQRLINILTMNLRDLTNNDLNTGNKIDNIRIKIPYNLIIPTPIPVKLGISYGNFEDDFNNKLINIKNSYIKISCITNFPLLVLLIISSNNNIGIFSGGFYSFPYYNSEDKGEVIDLENEYLTCIQKISIPSNNNNKINISNDINNLYCIYKYESIIKNMKDIKYTICIGVNNSMYVVNLSWLEYLTSSCIKSGLHDKIDDILRFLSEYPILESNCIINGDDTNLILEGNNFNTCNIVFNLLEIGKCRVFLLAPILQLNNEDNSINNNNEIINNIDHFYDIKEYIIKIDNIKIPHSDNLNDSKPLDIMDFLKVDSEYMNNLDVDLPSEGIIKQFFKDFHNQLQKEIQMSSYQGSYYIEGIKLLSKLNKDFLLRIDICEEPISNIIKTIKPRISLINSLYNNIKDTNTEILERENEINMKIKDILENGDKLSKYIQKIKNLLICELDNARIQYHQEITIPQLLILLSKAQLKLSNALLSSIDDNNYLNTNIINLFEYYSKRNENLMINFEDLQNKILQINKLISKDYQV
ncbi:hypothetical protein cand_028080 [Cryptosporidium andersoni]|uniref:Uncharacterized protein n=1 Tax=Cryptosporidium andersoni TaxID=117008 RepID=A0A1J4MRJ9_9CRYT|nr:hypothetical protein cand_028080 [Cryptosporidium andersoni]